MDRWVSNLKEIMIVNNLEEDYEILNFIAEGSWGKVYRARSIDTQEIVAVKMISKEMVYER
jgi:serine/threonine protein kinase